MSDDEKKMQFLTVIAELVERSKSGEDYLEPLIGMAAFPPTMRLKLLEIQTTLKLQNLFLRRLAESSMLFEEKMDEILNKIEVALDEKDDDAGHTE